MVMSKSVNFGCNFPDPLMVSFVSVNKYKQLAVFHKELVTSFILSCFGHSRKSFNSIINHHNGSIRKNIDILIENII